MQEHNLKTLAPYWDAVARGEKTFEVRRDDRGFQKGDILLLRRMDDDNRRIYQTANGHSSFPDYVLTIKARVEYVLTGGQFGIEPGYVVMALADIEKLNT